MELKIEDIYKRLKSIQTTVDNKREESFDNKKAFKYLYNSILNLIDELDYISEDEDLLDDDWDPFSEQEEKNYESSNPGIKEQDEFGPVIDLDDLV